MPGQPPFSPRQIAYGTTAGSFVSNPWISMTCHDDVLLFLGVTCDLTHVSRWPTSQRNRGHSHGTCVACNSSAPARIFHQTVQEWKPADFRSLTWIKETVALPYLPVATIVWHLVAKRLELTSRQFFISASHWDAPAMGRSADHISCWWGKKMFETLCTVHNCLQMCANQATSETNSRWQPQKL